jgi:hypothetical protein
MAMGQDEADGDPLLKAIGEFRQELTHWIDGRIASLREQDAELEPPALEQDLDPTPFAAEPRDAELAGDPRNRLDLLARHLNDRLRGSEAARAGIGCHRREKPDRPSNQ